MDLPGPRFQATGVEIQSSIKIPLLDPGPANQRQRLDASLATPLSQQAVRSVVPITVEVARTTLTLRELANLRPGDVIPLHKHPASPLTVAVAGTPKFYAEPGQYMAHCAARIIKPIPTP